VGKPHPVELRVRATRLVEQGHTHTEAARQLCISVKFVNDMVRLKRETGSHHVMSMKTRNGIM